MVAASKKPDPYRTTYNKDLDYNIKEDFVSYSYIGLIIDYIVERMKVKKNDIQISISNGDYSVEVSPDSLETVLFDSAKYDRKVASFRIKSGLKYFDTPTHGSIEVSIRLRNEEGYPKTNAATVMVYGVAEDRESSQRIIDWGDGTLKGFESLLQKPQKPLVKEYIVLGGAAKTLLYGELTGQVDKSGIQTVRITEPVEVSDRGLKELAKPQVYIPLAVAILAIIVTIVIAFVQSGR